MRFSNRARSSFVHISPVLKPIKYIKYEFEGYIHFLRKLYILTMLNLSKSKLFKLLSIMFTKDVREKHPKGRSEMNES